MSDVGHDLHALFPAEGEILHWLKEQSAHFRTLAAKHHELGKEIHRIEAGIEAAAHDRLEALKRDRLALLDQIAAVIATKRAA